jgi:AbrB family looped-hinge helix DNA binding protein
MKIAESARVGKRGTFVIPAALRRRFGLDEGSDIIVEERADGILIRPAVTLPIEIYSDRRKAEFILSNAVDAADYADARIAVEEMGIDPDSIPHRRPNG